jgi:hypothetical protein
MAIKGKSKSRSARAVTQGPKPVYQPVRRPVLARRGFWLVVAGVLGTLLVGALVAGVLFELDASRQDALEERMSAAVSEYQGDIDPILSAIGQPQPPSGFVAFTDLTQTVTALENETKDEPADSRALKATANAAVASAKTALHAFEEIDESAILQHKGFSEAFVLYVIDSKGNFVRAVSLYRETARLVALAADAEGPEREALTGSARGVLGAATEIFTRAYAEYVEAQTQAGVFQPSAPVVGASGS